MSDFRTKIKEINVVSELSFPLRPQLTFLAILTIAYDDVDSQQVEELCEFKNPADWTDEDIAMISAHSMVALMCSRLGMEIKIPLCNMAIRWFAIKNVSPEIAAWILMSLIIYRSDFDIVYGIRISIYNYFSKPGLRANCSFTILPDGELKLHIRDKSIFNGDKIQAYLFLGEEYRRLVREVGNPQIGAVHRYDYKWRIRGELDEPVSTYNTDPSKVGFGLKAKKQEAEKLKQEQVALETSASSSSSTPTSSIDDVEKQKALESPHLEKTEEPEAKRLKETKQEQGVLETPDFSKSSTSISNMVEKPFNDENVDPLLN